jgi:peptidoglycan L-alanyl-D-glutamate endopeptidase CwlK
VELLEEAIKTTPLDFSVLCGYRTEKEQTAPYNAGFSTVQFPNSYHNKWPSEAVDIAPFYKSSPHIRWSELDDFKKLIKHIKKTAKKLKIDIECGADWKEFQDFPHIQITEKTDGESNS